MNQEHSRRTRPPPGLMGINETILTRASLSTTLVDKDDLFPHHHHHTTRVFTPTFLHETCDTPRESLFQRMDHMPDQLITHAHRFAALCAVASMGLLTACSPNADNNGSTTPPPVQLKDSGPITMPGEDMDMDSTVTGDGTDPADEGLPDDMPGTEGDDGGTMPVTGLCSNVQDLGVLDPQQGTYMLNGSTIDTSILNKFATSCGSGTAPEVGWKFTVEEPIGVRSNILSAGIGWVLELHKGTCSETTVNFCDPNLETNFVLPVGEYILLAEPRVNMRGELALQLDLTPLVCFPVGTTECNGDNVSICGGGGATKIDKTCIEPCNGTACGGDLCENAIVVDTLPFTYGGPIEGHSDRINFNTANSCVNPSNAVASGGGDDPDDPDLGEPGEPGETTGLIRTPGQDVVFLVKGLTQGQKLFVDASATAGDTADSVLFVLDTCDKMTCHLAVDLGDIINGWEIPKDGDYTIILDRTTDNNADVGIEIRVE